MSEEKPTYDPNGLQEMLKQVLGELPVGVDVLKSVQIIHHSLLQQEARRLSRTLGPDHERVQRLEARRAHSLRVAKDLEAEMEVVRIRPPEVEEKDALLHGRIIDEHERGLVDVTVNLEDENGKVVRFLGEVSTDVNGYYALRVDPEKIARMSRIEGEAGYLTIRSRTGKVLHRETEPLKIAEGDRHYLDVTLRREGLWPIRTRPRDETEKEREGEKTEPSAPWIVRGRVTDEHGQGIKGLMVRLFDKDRRYDDLLGAVLTDDNGEFQITYRIQDFREGLEPGADLYLNVLDVDGNELYSSEDVVRFDAGREEYFEIVIKRGQIEAIPE